jgi:hypothetical protein
MSRRSATATIENGSRSVAMIGRRWLGAAALLALAGCEPAGDVGPVPDDGALGQSEVDVDELRLAAALDPLREGWTTIEPGGDTICSDGSDYRFFVRRGDPEKLVVYFQGGGACWFADNCSTQLNPSYKVNVGENEPERYRGIFDFNHEENPFADYSFVMVPYCTADVHLGDTVTRYEAPATESQAAHQVVIHHKGIVNAEAALTWTHQHFLDPREVFVTGSSAGAIPSPYYAWRVAEAYPDAHIAQLGDGAGGYRRSEALQNNPITAWGTLDYLSRYPEFAGMTERDFTYESLYVAAARRFPGTLFAQYDAAEDAVQKRFLTLGGSAPANLRDLLLANHADIRDEVDNFRAYVAGGDSHTILARPEFYTYHVGGVRIRDWVAGLARFEAVADVTCDRCGVAEESSAPDR